MPRGVEERHIVVGGKLQNYDQVCIHFLGAYGTEQAELISKYRSRLFSDTVIPVRSSWSLRHSIL